MNENDKRQILLIAAVTALLVGLFFVLVIRTEMRLLRQTREELAAILRQANETHQLASQWEHWQERARLASNTLSELERELPAGDVYRWQLQRFLNPKVPGLQITDIEPPQSADPLLPGTNAPYATVSFTLNGKAQYHDFGRFLAELENRYIHLRVEALELQPTAPDAIKSAEARLLFFKLDLLGLSQSPSGMKRAGAEIP